ADNPSYRLAGGTQMLIDILARKLSGEAILLNKRVTAINETDNKLLLKTNKGDTLEADKVILCIPPQLAATNITFRPALPDAFSAFLPTVQTWMAGSIKFTLEYEQPFWRNNGY